MANLEELVRKHPPDRTALLDIIRDVQQQIGCVPSEAIKKIALHVGLSAVDVEGVVTFYHFFSQAPVGRYAVHLNNNIVSVMNGREAVARTFEKESGCRFGETTTDGLIGLHATSCIGMNDQEPSAIINGVVFTKLTPKKARDLVGAMKAGKDIVEMVDKYGDGANQSNFVRSMVRNNIRKKGPVILAPFKPGSALKNALSLSPDEVIIELKLSNLLGRGGAGFPAGLKWEFCRREKNAHHYVLCNADEGEPGTFKDRVILTEMPQLLFEGMAVAGYAVGAELGVLYLRSEYAYLLSYLENVVERLRQAGLLGRNAGGKEGFNFDIQIKLGAGAYICGEESALLESAEGKRGEPRDRPPFPVQVGYLGAPTTVNNVETLCAAARIMLNGAPWFKSLGTPSSPGTKLLSVSGDCRKPGIYEIEFGLTVHDLLDLVGGEGAQAVQVGGPSGTCVAPTGFGRKLSFTDLPTGGSIIVIGPQRNLFEIVHNFMDFFVEESCGWCTPCRAGNVLLKNKLEKIMKGKGTAADLSEIEAWGKTVKAASRCGMGQTSANPILTTLQNFRPLYEAKIDKTADYVPEFDLQAAVQDACLATGRAAHLEGE